MPKIRRKSRVAKVRVNRAPGSGRFKSKPPKRTIITVRRSASTGRFTSR